MASGAQLSEEAGGVGGLFQVPSTNHVTGEPGDFSAGGEIEVASANQSPEGTEGVGGLLGVSHTNQVTEEAGSVCGEVRVGHADQVIEEAVCINGVTGIVHVTGVGGLDSEIAVESANRITREPGVLAGEIGVASVDQIIRDPDSLSAEITLASANHVKGEGASDSQIRATSVNHVTEAAGASCGDIKVVSLNQMPEEAIAPDAETETVSASPVNGEPADAGGEIGMASPDEVIEPGGSICKIGVASADEVNEPSGVSGKIGVASADEVNEPGGRIGEIEMVSANEANGEPGGGGGEVGVASSVQMNGKPEGQIDGIRFASAYEEPRATGGENSAASSNQVNAESGGMGGENGVASANQMNRPAGGDGDKFGVASAIQVNREPGSRSSEISLASANQMNEEPGGDIGLVSANQVNGEPGASIGMASANQVNGISRRVGDELEVEEKHRWADTKVYRRRPKGENNKGFLSDLTKAHVTKSLICNGTRSQNDKATELNTHLNNQNLNTECVDGNGVAESEIIVSASGYNDNLTQIQPETLGEVMSNKELTSARMDGATPIPVDPTVTNGAVKPSDSASGSKVRINFASTAKVELRELKRKFENELYIVRKAVKRMDGGRDEVVHEFFQPVVNSSVLSNGTRSNGFATRVYSGTRSLGHVPYKPNIRPFNQLRVSLVDNSHCMVDSIEREKRTPKANQFYRNSEFLLANDKFPPPESNKKTKSNGKKSSGGEFGFGVGSKVYKSCSALLEKLMKHKHSWVFNAPVDVKGLGLHDYFLIIKNPMDLGTVKAKLIKYWYKSPMEFAEDVRLTFHNAMMYNPKGHDVHIMAETLLKIFEGKWPDIEVKYLRELRMAVEPDMGYPTPTSRMSNPFQLSAFPPLETRVFNRSESMPHPVNPKPRTLTPAPSFRTPALKKPKAKDVNKREMTYDEKQKLSTNLQSLPPEKLDGVIQIIKKRSTALSQNDDEIEVDIDSVDTETLWELDRFVTNYKKSLSKIRRKAELANQMRAEARQAAEKLAIPEPLPKESTAGYGNATQSLPLHQNDPAVNASGSSSSSSSSSSGSSSSDSDSDSSSEESDGGRSPGT